MSELNEKFAEIKELTTSRIEEIKEEAKKRGDEIDAKLAELAPEKLGEEFKKEITGEMTKNMETVIELQKQVDALEKAGHGNTREGNSFKDALAKELASNKSLEAYKKGDSTKASFEVKASLVTGTNASGDTIAADRLGLQYDPTRAVRMRDILGTGSTSSNNIRFPQENTYTNNAAMKAEGAAFGESEFKLVPVDSPVETLGSHITISNEMMEDLGVFSAYISTRLPQKVLNVEDAQILTGDGSSPNIQGIAASGGGTAYAAAADASAGTGFRNFFLPANFGTDVSGSVNEYDVLVTAIHQCINTEYTPSAIVLNPYDYHALLLRKSTQWDYVREGILPTVMGVPVIKSTAQSAGSFLVGDFNLGATLFFRENIGVEFSNSNNDDFEKNMTTVRAKERIALPITRPNAFSWGTFAAAKTALK